MCSQIYIMIPTLLPRSDHLLAPSWADLYLISTICALHIMVVRSHVMLCCSFLNGLVLRPTTKNPGDHLLYHSIMESSSALIHDGKNWSAIFWFQASSNFRIWINSYSYGTYLLVYWIAPSISLNRLWDMMWWIQMENLCTYRDT